MSTDQQPSNYQYIFKIIIIGDIGVGKSCILNRYIKEEFDENYTCTVGVNLISKTIEINEKEVKLQIWDTAGQEKYRSIISSYYKGSNIAFVVFDITNKSSFDAIPNWIEAYYRNGPDSQKNIILIGNKKDLEEKREVSQEEAQKFSEANNIVYFETSAKDGDNIEKVFKYGAEKLLEFYSNNNDELKNNEELQAQNYKEVKTEKKGCC